MYAKKTIRPIALSPQHELRSLVENRKAFTFNNCELNVFETYQKSEFVPLQFNDLVITNMLRGRKVMHLFGKPGFEYLPGETVIVPPSIRMEIDFPEASNQEPTQCTALAIDRNKISETLHFLNEFHPRSLGQGDWTFGFEKYHFYNNEQIAQLINKLLAISVSNEFFKDALTDVTLKELLIRIMQLQNLHLAQDGEENKSASRLAFIGSYIRTHLNEDLNIDLLSARANMSKPSFYRSFKSEFGISPTEYVIRERIRASKAILSANASVKEACFAVGFNNMNYFIRMFKKHEGITPGAFQIVSV